MHPCKFTTTIKIINKKKVPTECTNEAARAILARTGLSQYGYGQKIYGGARRLWRMKIVIGGAPNISIPLRSFHVRDRRSGPFWIVCIRMYITYVYLCGVYAINNEWMINNNQQRFGFFFWEIHKNKINWILKYLMISIVKYFIVIKFSKYFI